MRANCQLKFEALGSSRAELARIVKRVPRRVRKKGEYRALGRAIPAESCSKSLTDRARGRQQLAIIVMPQQVCQRLHKTWIGI